MSYRSHLDAFNAAGAAQEGLKDLGRQHGLHVQTHSHALFLQDGLELRLTFDEARTDDLLDFETKVRLFLHTLFDALPHFNVRAMAKVHDFLMLPSKALTAEELLENLVITTGNMDRLRTSVTFVLEEVRK